MICIYFKSKQFVINTRIRGNICFEAFELCIMHDFLRTKPSRISKTFFFTSFHVGNHVLSTCDRSRLVALLTVKNTNILYNCDRQPTLIRFLTFFVIFYSFVTFQSVKEYNIILYQLQLLNLFCQLSRYRNSLINWVLKNV